MFKQCALKIIQLTTTPQQIDQSFTKQKCDRDPIENAVAGFYFTVIEKIYVCIHWGIVIFEWYSQDEPLKEHLTSGFKRILRKKSSKKQFSKTR